MSVRALTGAERERLLDLGYEVIRNAVGQDMAKPSYRFHDFNHALTELAFTDVVGEETARALDALGRLGDAAGAQRLRDEALKKDRARARVWARVEELATHPNRRRRLLHLRRSERRALRRETEAA